MATKFPVSPKLATQFAANHPVRNKAAEEKLLAFITERLEIGREKRVALLERMEHIDRQLSGYLELSASDQKRRLEQLQGKSLKPTDVNLQLVAMQVDEAITYFMSVFAPDTDMFHAVAPKEKQEIANAFALLLNTHAEERQYYRHIAMSLFDALKYNVGGLRVEWLRVMGKILGNNEDGSVSEEKGVVWQGNEIDAVDLYNFLWDPAVDLPDLAAEGEWCATVEAKTGFAVRRMAEKGELYAVDKLNGLSSFELSYYEDKPDIRFDLSIEGNGSPKNWAKYLQKGSYSTIENAVELIHFYTWIVPYDYNLGTSRELSLFRITVANSQYIVNAVELNNTHSKLPFVFCMPIEDGMKLEQKSFSEILIPLQMFASFLINTHQRATRRSLYGFTVYDPTYFDFTEVEDDVSARVAVKPAGYGKDLRNHYIADYEGPKTEATLRQVEEVIGLMQHLLPTDMLKQVAGLERATQYQAAATVQGGNRRSQKLARIIDSQMFGNMRDLLMQNIFQYQESIEILSPSGELVDVQPSQFRTAGIRYIVQEGLKSIDKLVTMTVLKDIINSIIQSKEAMQEFNLAELLDYFSSLAGDNSDLTRFKRQEQAPQQPAPQNPQPPA